MHAKRHEIEEQELQGLKYFKALSGLLEKLHEVGCQRDRAGNRLLHRDQYVALLLLYRFHPICTSLRSLQQASELKKVQKKLGVPRASLGSLSEAATVFDSQQMVQVIAELGQQRQPLAVPDKLQNLPGILTAVDGTLLKALPKITWALWLDEQVAMRRLLTSFAVGATPRGCPSSGRARGPAPTGNGNEKDVLAAHLQAGRIYVMDRGYAKYDLWQQILDQGSSFVNRIRDNYVGEVIEERPISAEGQAVGVVRDRLLRLGSDPRRHDLAEPVRVLEVQCTPHPKRTHTGRGGPEQSETLAIATDLVDLEADVIALIFQYRWTIEIFFRFYKHILGCRHLLSHNRNGIELQTYAAIVACMLISLWTGRKPTLRTFEMLCWYFTGMASEEELLAQVTQLGG